MIVLHLNDKMGVLLRAPVAILSAVFWITLSLLILFYMQNHNQCYFFQGFYV